MPLFTDRTFSHRADVFRILLLLFIITPIAEFALLYSLADSIGLPFTVGLVLVTGIVGAWLAKKEGLRTWQNIHQQLEAGHMPSSSLLDALMIFLAGALLVTPGILTDAFGFSLLIPPCRSLYKRLAKRYFRTRFHISGTGFPPGGSGGQPPQSTRIIDSYVVESPPESIEQPETEKQSSE